MSTSSSFGQMQIARLGNQLFQYASLIGLSQKFNTNLLLPAWEYSQYFNSEFPEGNVTGIELSETSFKYTDEWGPIDWNNAIDVKGYLQSEKYWAHCEKLVREKLAFKPELKDRMRAKYKDALSRKNIAISIRRGDFIFNPNF
jgi:hypothetical protein